MAVETMEKNNNDHNNSKRKGSWDSKMSISSVATRPYLRSDTPSSILSSDSDIRFTRKMSNQYRSCCYLAASLLLFLLFATLSMYAAHKYLWRGPVADKVFLGSVQVTAGDEFEAGLTDPASEEFRVKAREYREGFNLWLKRSELRPAFIHTEVLAFNGGDGEPLTVHFNARFNPRRQRVSSEDVLRVLSRDTGYLGNRTLDPSTLHIHEEVLESRQRQVSTTPGDFVTTTPRQPPARVCDSVRLPYCSSASLASNTTSYPNIVGHASIAHVIDDVIAFRELVDSECYRLAYEFVCLVLQPPCSSQLVLPCRPFCQQFWQGCGARLSPRLSQALNCSNFPEYSADSSCVPKPGCREELEARGLGVRLCDGHADCPDLSDELSCSHCPPGTLPCAAGAVCVRPENHCDGTPHCPDGSDERACLMVRPKGDGRRGEAGVQPRRYHEGGEAILTERGTRAKLCLDNLNSSLPSPADRDRALDTLASSICSSLHFTEVKKVSVEVDKEEGWRYVVMAEPGAQEITFLPSSCPSRQVLSLHCQAPSCGLSTVRTSQDVDGMPRLAAPGHWPWHVALFKAGSHVCDGTLVHVDWVLSTASCFQGQGKAEWVVRAGSTRLSSTPPWQQERHIVGMVKSPVEGSTVVMLKLSKSLAPSDFVRPACLPPLGDTHTNLTHCNTLGWTKQRTVLQRVELRLSDMEQCANISITTVNSVCTDSHYNNEDCMEEELAGSPMMCLAGDRWVVAAVSNWRIACSKVGDRRPRLYDSTTSNVDWIRSVLARDASS